MKHNFKIINYDSKSICANIVNIFKDYKVVLEKHFTKIKNISKYAEFCFLENSLTVYCSKTLLGSTIIPQKEKYQIKVDNFQMDSLNKNEVLNLTFPDIESRNIKNEKK